MSDVAQVNPVDLDFPEFSQRYLHITPKAGGVIPFELNEPQLRLWKIIRETRDAGKPVRIMILKARQMGFSTFSLGLMYHYTTTRPGVMSFLASYDDDSVVDLFERARLMYDLAPEKPMTRYSNRTELNFANPDRQQARFEPGLQSKVRIGTAGRARLGRSKTLRYLHLSEVAFWENAKRVLLGLEQALPDDVDTVELIESTANGVGGEFYERWKRAEDPTTRGDWQAVFFPWFEFSEYQRPIEGGVMCPVPSCVSDVAGFEREEQELQGMHKLTAQQMNWRRWAIVNKCGNDMEQFRQEYPSSANEAFLTSGRPVFNRERLAYRIRELQAQDLRIKAEHGKPRGVKGSLRQEKGKIQFYPNPDGPLTVYKFPEPKKRTEYVIGGDACRGISNSDDPDFAEAHVYDSYTWEQVAVFRDRVEASAFARVLRDLGWFYGKALLVPESNDHGNTVCVKLQDMEYPRTYLREELDRLGGPPVKKPGWETNRKTRPILVDAVDHAINANLARFNDIPFLEQCCVFVRNPKTGKAEADEGCHDDGVIASALALAVMGRPQGRPEARRSKVDRHRGKPDAAMVARDIARHKAAIRRARQIASEGDDLMTWTGR